MYITKLQLRKLGFTQPDSTLIPLLEEINKEVARHIEEEIPLEIKQNYDERVLQEYLRMRERNGFTSPVVQNWLRQNIKAFDEIIIDWREIMLHKIVTTLDEITKPSKGGSNE